MKTIATINQKGGVGKTTIALATAQGLAARGYRVLFVDLDPQQNASLVLRVKGIHPTSLDVLLGNAEIQEAIKDNGSLHIIPADKGAARAESLIEGIGKEYRLAEALKSVAALYDFCVIDTPPALGVLTTNALTAADTAVIPAQADIFSLEGIKQLGQTVDAVQKYANPNLSIAGVLLTRYNARSTLSREIHEAAQEAAQQLHTVVFATPIREAVAVREAQLLKQSLEEYAPRAKVTQDFSAYIEELLERV